MEYCMRGPFVPFDPLSLFFLAVIALVSVPSMVYAVGYLKGHYSPGRIRLCHGLAGLFIVSMAAVVVSGDMLSFLIAWEIMSLVSFFLVMFDHEQAGPVRAGLLYMVMTHFGTAFLLAAFLIMFSHAGSWDFASVKEACQTMPAQVKNILFILLLVGFGTKAGIVPLHIWLPAAHPQAPSHISSIMSGVMIKTAVFGMIRFIIQILGVASQWWGIALLVLAGISCLMGVVYALMDRDLKKLLAFSSVENMGIILLGVGGCMLFSSIGSLALATVSLAAALYHLVNHAAFKGLLFLGAGSVYAASGTRNMEKLGGLIKKMPMTALYFLIGSMAISGLPPLSGFVSEWLTLQVFFQGAWAGGPGWLRIFLGICAATLALTGGMAAACFVKAFGITFLALPRSPAAEKAKETGFYMQAGMAFLGAVTVLLGLGAAPVFSALSRIAAHTLGAGGAEGSRGGLQLALIPGQGASVSTLLLAVLLFLAVMAAYMFLKPSAVKIFKTWDCGYYRLDSRNEYTATAQSKPFRLAFAFFLLPHSRTLRFRESYYHFTRFIYQTRTTAIFGKFLYRPLAASVFRFSSSMRKLQAGSIHVYIGYIFVTLALLLALAVR